MIDTMLKWLIISLFDLYRQLKLHKVNFGDKMLNKIYDLILSII